MTGPRALLLALIASVTLPAVAASRSAAAQSEPAEVQFNSTGVGRVSVEPDVAVVVFSVRAISKTAQGAVGDNARNVDALLNSLRAFAGSGDRIEARRLSARSGRGGLRRRHRHPGQDHAGEGR